MAISYSSSIDYKTVDTINYFEMFADNSTNITAIE